MNLRSRISANVWQKKPLFSQVVNKAIKISKALLHRTKKTKAGISLKLNSSLSAFHTSDDILKGVEYVFTPLSTFSDIFIIIIWVYIFMFVTARQAHCMRDLPILKILSVLAMIRQAYVCEWIKVVWCVKRY